MKALTSPIHKIQSLLPQDAQQELKEAQSRVAFHVEKILQSVDQRTFMPYTGLLEYHIVESDYDQTQIISEYTRSESDHFQALSDEPEPLKNRVLKESHKIIESLIPEGTHEEEFFYRSRSANLVLQSTLLRMILSVGTVKKCLSCGDVQLGKLDEKTLFSLLEHFQSLESLTLSVETIKSLNPAGMTHLISKLTKLKKIIFKSLDSSEEMDEAIELINGLKHLVSLSFPDSLTIKKITKVCSVAPKLKELVIDSGILNISDTKDWKQLLATLPELRVLTCGAFYYSTLPKIRLQEVMTACVGLRALNLLGVVYLEDGGKTSTLDLKHLSALEVNWEVVKTNREFLEAFPFLKHLHLTNFDTIDLSPEEQDEIFDSLHHLKSLSIDGVRIGNQNRWGVFLKAISKIPNLTLNNAKIPSDSNISQADFFPINTQTHSLSIIGEFPGSQDENICRAFFESFQSVHSLNLESAYAKHLSFELLCFLVESPGLKHLSLPFQLPQLSEEQCFLLSKKISKLKTLQFFNFANNLALPMLRKALLSELGSVERIYTCNQDYTTLVREFPHLATKFIVL